VGTERGAGGGTDIEKVDFLEEFLLVVFEDADHESGRQGGVRV